MPVAEYASNLAAMVGAAQDARIANILLLTPPPVGDEARPPYRARTVVLEEFEQGEELALRTVRSPFTIEAIKRFWLSRICPKVPWSPSSR